MLGYAVVEMGLWHLSVCCLRTWILHLGLSCSWQQRILPRWHRLAQLTRDALYCKYWFESLPHSEHSFSVFNPSLLIMLPLFFPMLCLPCVTLLYTSPEYRTKTL